MDKHDGGLLNPCILVIFFIFLLLGILYLHPHEFLINLYYEPAFINIGKNLLQFASYLENTRHPLVQPKRPKTHSCMHVFISTCSRRRLIVLSRVIRVRVVLRTKELQTLAMAKGIMWLITMSLL